MVPACMPVAVGDGPNRRAVDKLVDYAEANPHRIPKIGKYLNIELAKARSRNQTSTVQAVCMVYETLIAADGVSILSLQPSLVEVLRILLQKGEPHISQAAALRVYVFWLRNLKRGAVGTLSVEQQWLVSRIVSFAKNSTSKRVRAAAIVAISELLRLGDFLPSSPFMEDVVRSVLTAYMDWKPSDEEDGDDELTQWEDPGIAAWRCLLSIAALIKDIIVAKRLLGAGVFTVFTRDGLWEKAPDKVKEVCLRIHVNRPETALNSPVIDCLLVLLESKSRVDGRPLMSRAAAASIVQCIAAILESDTCAGTDPTGSGEGAIRARRASLSLPSLARMLGYYILVKAEDTMAGKENDPIHESILTCLKFFLEDIHDRLLLAEVVSRVLERGITLHREVEDNVALSATISAVKDLVELLLSPSILRSLRATEGRDPVKGDALPSALVYQLVQYMSCREEVAREDAHRVLALLSGPCSQSGSDSGDDSLRVLGSLTAKQGCQVLVGIWNRCNTREVTAREMPFVCDTCFWLVNTRVVRSTLVMQLAHSIEMLCASNTTDSTAKALLLSLSIGILGAVAASLPEGSRQRCVAEVRGVMTYAEQRSLGHPSLEFVDTPLRVLALHYNPEAKGRVSEDSWSSQGGKLAWGGKLVETLLTHLRHDKAVDLSSIMAPFRTEDHRADLLDTMAELGPSEDDIAGWKANYQNAELDNTADESGQASNARESIGIVEVLNESSNPVFASAVETMPAGDGSDEDTPLTFHEAARMCATSARSFSALCHVATAK